MIKSVILIVSWFIIGGLAFYAYGIYSENQQLAADSSVLRELRQQYQQQIDINASQREELETQIQQLQENMLGAQTQMLNLSQALQEAREMITPIPATAINNAESTHVQ